MKKVLIHQIHTHTNTYKIKIDFKAIRVPKYHWDICKHIFLSRILLTES
jgi:hypothetical protein